MKTEYNSIIYPKRHSFAVVCAVALVLQVGVLAGFAQTGTYLFTGSMTTITLNPGTYDITAYGAAGGGSVFGSVGGFGAEMEAQFTFAAAVNLTILVGGGGGFCYSGGGGGGGGGSFVVNGNTPLLIAGGGGGNDSYAAGSGLTGSSGGNGLNGNSNRGTGAGGNGGTGGNGGLDYTGGGGGGFNSDGSNASSFYGNSYGGFGGSSFLHDGAGGSPPPGQNGGNGGYGGGGGGGQNGGGGGGGYSGGGGGGGTYSGGGGGGGSIIDSSALAIFTEVSGVASSNGSPNGEIIITAVPEPSALGLLAIAAAALFVRRCWNLEKVSPESSPSEQSTGGNGAMRGQ
jgi:hypothetical protein